MSPDHVEEAAKRLYERDQAYRTGKRPEHSKLRPSKPGRHAGHRTRMGHLHRPPTDPKEGATRPATPSNKP